ncbi:unnamed protein product [Adineta ricciae]|uniref:N-acetylgalactosaminide beta-1,3-galactosyltransferase n=1 Tax=Adineta ricciae TaxID=249248 RepID=A0A815S2U6_ADIRI|nr:unnamed protein product [Adineta ricciae]
MRLLRCRRLLIYFIFSYILFFVILFREKLQLTTTRSPATTSDTPKIAINLIFLIVGLISIINNGKMENIFLQGNPKNLRTRCDIMMCTFGVTLHPSRLFFVGETASDSRLPVYNVVKPNTPRPVNRKGSMQKLAQGLDMVVSKLRERDYNNEIEWIMVMDDDTFISPPNLNLLAAEYDSQRPVMIGQHTCKVGFCGGGGYLISRTLFVQLPAFVKKCRPHDGLWDSDQFVPDCIRRKVQVELIDRKEFNSQNPEFYSTPLGLRDHPNGFGRAVTFHYMKTPMKYVNLWRLHQAYMRE